jgi:hypothetical protein
VQEDQRAAAEALDAGALPQGALAQLVGGPRGWQAVPPFLALGISMA